MTTPDHTRTERKDRRQSAWRLRAGTAKAISVVVWGLAAIAFALLADFAQMDAITLAMLAVAFFMPAVVITLGLLVAVSAATLRQETLHLQGSIDELRHTMLERPEPMPLRLTDQAKIGFAAAPSDDTNTRLALFSSQRAPRPIPQSDAIVEQASLALSVQPEHAPPDPLELIRALHFPEDENDAEGFEALRKALSDTRTGPLIRAAQTVLTHLAQEGIYMDDLRPDRARPEFWRAFAHGARGPLIAPLGGVRDRSCLALTSARMRSNPEFKSAVHLFLREFDRVFAEFEAIADDAQIGAFSDTRSARAFMLLGRVNGVFSR